MQPSRSSLLTRNRPIQLQRRKEDPVRHLLQKLLQPLRLKAGHLRQKHPRRRLKPPLTPPHPREVLRQRRRLQKLVKHQNNRQLRRLQLQKVRVRMISLLG